MSDGETLILSLACGVLLGTAHFGLLWLSLHGLGRTRSPARALAGSFLIRTGLLAAGLWLASGGTWDRLLACLAGILVGRWIVFRLIRRPRA